MHARHEFAQGEQKRAPKQPGAENSDALRQIGAHRSTGKGLHETKRALVCNAPPLTRMAGFRVTSRNEEDLARARITHLLSRLEITHVHHVLRLGIDTGRINEATASGNR